MISFYYNFLYSLCLYVNIDTIMKYLGLELSLSVGLCGKGVGFGVFFLICDWLCSRGKGQ